MGRLSTLNNMARSTYIYVVFLQKKLAGTFTVKHEMESWLPESSEGVEIWRMKDGRYQVPPIEITDEFYEH